MSTEPLVSVVIPVYNGEPYIAQAITSVLEQTYQPVQVIVIDDGSTDQTGTVVQKFGAAVQYIHQENGGTGSARNHGAQLAKGEFLAFLDADDLWTPDKLRKQVSILQTEPQLAMVFGWVQQFISPELDEEIKKHIACPEEPMAGYTQMTMLIRREAFFKVGLFGTHWEVGEYVDWYARAQEAGLTSRMIFEVVAHRRLHTTNMGVTLRNERADYVRILKAALDRRRQAGNGQP